MTFHPVLLISLGIALVIGQVRADEALDLNDLAGAESQLEILVGQWEAAYSDDRSDENKINLALSLQALGSVEKQLGKPDEALAHLDSACEIYEAHAPSLLIDALEVKALILQDQGKLEESEKLLRKVLEARDQAEMDEPQKLAATLDHLAMCLLHQGRYPEVAPLIDRAIALAERDVPAILGRLLDHKGRLFHTLGSHSKAIDSFRLALEQPIESPEMKLTLESQIALAQLRLGKLAEAQAGAERTAEEARRIFEDDPSRAVPYINNLGELYLSIGDSQAAVTAFSRVVEILEATLGARHPSLIGPLNNLGVSLMAIGDYPGARRELERAADLQKDHLPPTHLRVAETERNLARVALLAADVDAPAHVEKATKIGLALLDRLIREGSEKERLNFLERFELSSLPCAIGDPELIADVLLASKARLLDAMLSDDAPQRRLSWRDVQAALPMGSAFVDTCRYFTEGFPSVESYGALVILPEGEPIWIPLGAAEELRRWLDAFRNRLIWRSASLAGDAGPAPPLKLRGILRILHRDFWKPIAEVLPPDTGHIAYSPAGILHFLPLSALLGEDDLPLSRQYLQLTTVASGRDLLAPPAVQAIDSAPWAVLTVSRFPKSPDSGSDDPLLSLLGNLQEMPGTREEARRIGRIAPDDSLFLANRKATEESLSSLPFTPSVLHLGCHAFFLSGTPPSPGHAVDFDERSDLLFSGGLVLYRGAERGPDDNRINPSDDLLFPSEIAGLDLGGTRLVTLSSCESGAGTPVAGEGVLGLRRAFAIAGVRETVVALWPVSDSSTPRFMDAFYSRTLASGRPAQSLWQTQGDFLTSAESDEGFELAVLRYAPFVLSQNLPLAVGPTIPPVPVPDDPGFGFSRWWLLLTALPLALYALARGTRRSRP